MTYDLTISVLIQALDLYAFVGVFQLLKAFSTSGTYCWSTWLHAKAAIM